MNPTSSFSQCRIAAMKNEESTAMAHPPTTPVPTPGRVWGMGVVGGCAGAVPAPQLNTDAICAP